LAPDHFVSTLVRWRIQSFSSFDEIKLYRLYSWNQVLSLAEREGGLSGSALRSIYLFDIATTELQKAA
jgi:hypothetical protein